MNVKLCTDCKFYRPGVDLEPTDCCDFPLLDPIGGRAAPTLPIDAAQSRFTGPCGYGALFWVAKDEPA